MESNARPLNGNDERMKLHELFVNALENDTVLQELYSEMESEIETSAPTYQVSKNGNHLTIEQSDSMKAIQTQIDIRIKEIADFYKINQ